MVAPVSAIVSRATGIDKPNDFHVVSLSQINLYYEEMKHRGTVRSLPPAGPRPDTGSKRCRTARRAADFWRPPAAAIELNCGLLKLWRQGHPHQWVQAGLQWSPATVARLRFKFI